MKTMRALSVVAIVCIGVAGHLRAQTTAHTIVLDSFDSVSQWTAAPAQGVEISIHPDSNGAHGRAMRLDFDFNGHGGYAVVHRALDMTLPTNDIDLKRLAAIEFAITAGSGGKGSVWLDDLAVTPISLAGTPATSLSLAATPISPALGSIALSILLFAAGAAFTRAPLLRRQLLALGSPRYTPAPVTKVSTRLMKAMDSWSATLGGGRSAPDSLIVWVLTLVSAVLAIALLGRIWPQVPDEISGVGFVLLGVGALAFSRRRSQPDAEIAHVALTAAVFWILIGVSRVAPTPENLPACALVAALAINSVTRQFAGPRALAKLTIGLALLTIFSHELVFASQQNPGYRMVNESQSRFEHLRWLASEIVTLGAAAFIARKLIAETAEEKQGMVFAAASYLTALIVVWSALDPVWAPLVTTTYAILGAVLLILSRRPGAHSLLRYLGGATMLIVVGRLLLVDLSRVETIWRVLLFLVCGAVFLYTAYRMQTRPVGADER